MDKVYEHQKTEKNIYQLWEKSGFFNPDKLPFDKKSKPFCIIMPPPNANAPLHIGHGVFVTLQDLMIRFQRMRGKRTLWLPGTDHAGFETQVVFEKELEKQGKSGLEMNRDEFYKAVWQYTQKNKKIVRYQLKLLGASCDWSREKFTLDEDIQKTVYQTLEKLWKDGLLYRGKRIVNYCPKHKTAFSELEVKYQEQKDFLYFVRYKLKEERNKWITVATTRPETIPGDTAIAVNPKDNRYKKLINKVVIEPITKREIPIIADKDVEIDFGTGALKITPAHDSLDFEIGQRHHLETRETLDFNGYFNELAGPLAGLNVSQAREKSITILQASDSLVKKEEHVHQVGHCYKCNSRIEPMIMDQWFIAMTKPLPKKNKSLNDLAINAVKKGEIKIIPPRFEKVFFHWMNNIKDWNISRQIRWGIPIPAFHCEDCKESFIQIDKIPKKCLYCQSKNIKKDTDVLDTWFSSGQWPYATLFGNQGLKSKDFKTFYPTDIMETGWDILFFWVARMIILGIYYTGKIPFKYVYLHGLVRDKDRQKMSKSKGNVIDPLAVIDVYGADALRMALIIGNTAGNDIVISEEKIKGYRNFANKIWNASRFVISNLNDYDGKKPTLNVKDKKTLIAFKKTKQKITKNLENFKFSLAGEALYHYFWHTFADKIIEEMKNRIKDNQDKKQAQYILDIILKDCLKMLHPFMPFVTEAIWQKLPHYENKKDNLLIITQWPQ
ncbi:MAG: valine--tRNA ligase [Candidatus Pacebacteria bacterium]|nr:valine--tRNA ligase [Candidatus Paceibacterota bacterium]MDD5721887.1 valine--tRNA ligase [Candidatus Paceibacterota bacterium]